MQYQLKVLSPLAVWGDRLGIGEFWIDNSGRLVVCRSGRFDSDACSEFKASFANTEILELYEKFLPILKTCSDFSIRMGVFAMAFFNQIANSKMLSRADSMAKMQQQLKMSMLGQSLSSHQHRQQGSIDKLKERPKRSAVQELVDELKLPLINLLNRRYISSPAQEKNARTEEFGISCTQFAGYGVGQDSTEVYLPSPYVRHHLLKVFKRRLMVRDFSLGQGYGASQRESPSGSSELFFFKDSKVYCGEGLIAGSRLEGYADISTDEYVRVCNSETNQKLLSVVAKSGLNPNGGVILRLNEFDYLVDPDKLAGASAGYVEFFPI